ncbi:MAG: peptidylprolyl isomerase [Planctomycetota bacterium]
MAGAPPVSETIDGQPVSTMVDARPAAMIEGRGIVWGRLRPIMTELAGAQALQEMVLDERLESLVAEAGLTIDERDVAREEDLLLATLSDDRDRARGLLDELRDRERLGPTRYPRLLRRNAMLRALVRDEVKISDTDVMQMYDRVHGSKRQVRIITSPDLAAARLARTRVSEGEHFADVAVLLSTDTSASRGGLLQPFSRFNTSYPSAVRQAVWNLDGVGDVSDPILLDNGYALVRLERELPGSGVEMSSVEPRMRRLARMQRERELMDRVARREVGVAKVMIFDDDLSESWERLARVGE